MRLHILWLAGCLSMAAPAAESVLYPPRPQLSPSEWLQLRSQVMGQTDVECEPRTPLMRRCASDAMRTIWWLTEVGHEAHPGMVRQALVSKGGKVVLETSGYFAGDQTAFGRWYREILRNDQRELQSIVKKIAPALR